jgi:CO/xanthine dehydrogenase FAD-binding subunit
MIPASFAYHRPTTLTEALELKAQGALCLAGGTDVLVKLREEKIAPSALVDLKAIEEMRGIRTEGEGLFVGAATPIQDLVEHPALAPYQALVEGGGVLGCYEIRNRATIGGNICNASASADTLPGLLVHNASVRVASLAGTRTMPLGEFLLDLGTVALKEDEVLLGLVLPTPPPDAKSRFARASRVKGMDLAGINVALYYAPEGPEYRIAIGAVWPTVRRMTEAERLLRGRPFSPDTLTEGIGAILKDARPRASSLRATPDYKKAMIQVFIERGFADIIGGD